MLSKSRQYQRVKCHYSRCESSLYRTDTRRSTYTRSKPEQLLHMIDPEKMSAGAGHKAWHLLVIIAAVTSYVVTLVFHGLAYTDAGIRSGLFRNRTDILWEKYATEVTPNGWLFIGLWCGVYVGQAVWLAYGISQICRRGINGYLYQNPSTLPPTLYASFMLAMLGNALWLLVWDSESLIGALIVRLFMCIGAYACLILSYRALHKHGQTLIDNCMIWELIPIILAVQVALAMFATWMTHSSFIILASMLSSNGYLGMEDASTVTLVLIFFSLLLWFGCDIFLLDKYTRMTTPPYILTCTILGAIIDRKFVMWSRNSTLTAIILGVAVLLAASKLIIGGIRRRKKPLWVMSAKPAEPTPQQSTGNAVSGALLAACTLLIGGVRRIEKPLQVMSERPAEPAPQQPTGNAESGIV